MALVLTITTGRVAAERAEEFQARFRTAMMRRFTMAPFLRQALLVDLGGGEWQMQTLWDSALAQSHPVGNDVPLTVSIFREFGAEPEIRLGDVSAYLHPSPSPREPLPGEASIAQRLAVPDQQAYGLRVLEDDQTVPPRPEEDEAADVRRDGSVTGQDGDGS